MTPEAKVKQEVKRILFSCGVRSLPDYGEAGCYYMPVAGRFGKKGIPDFICNVGGWFFSIETKANGEEPTDLQSLTNTAITLARGIALVIDETNIKLLSELLTDVKNGKRERALQLSWRRNPVSTPVSNHKKRSPKSTSSSVERDRNWKNILSGLGD